MALIVTFQNVTEGDPTISSYEVVVFVNNQVISRERIDGHRRDEGWRALVKRLGIVSPETPYCGVELVGGWCKRAQAHPGDHACS